MTTRGLLDRLLVVAASLTVFAATMVPLATVVAVLCWPRSAQSMVFVNCAALAWAMSVFALTSCIHHGFAAVRLRVLLMLAALVGVAAVPNIVQGGAGAIPIVWSMLAVWPMFVLFVLLWPDPPPAACPDPMASREAADDDTSAFEETVNDAFACTIATALATRALFCWIAPPLFPITSEGTLALTAVSVWVPMLIMLDRRSAVPGWFRLSRRVGLISVGVLVATAPGLLAVGRADFLSVAVGHVFGTVWIVTDRAGVQTPSRTDRFVAWAALTAVLAPILWMTA